MGFELAACTSDSGNDPFFERMILEVLLDNISGSVPEIIRDYLADTPVSTYGKLVIVNGNVQQHAVGVPGIIHL
jgi:hypothetical protein